MVNDDSSDLNQTEKRLLLLLAKGYLLEGAASQLNVSKFTANKYLRNVFSKLEVQSTATALAKAIWEDVI